MAKRGDLDVLEVLSAARKGGTGRSEVYEWLWARYDELAPGLSHYGVDWDAMAAKFVAAGIKAGTRKRPVDPTGQIVRVTWYRVAGAKKAIADKPARKHASRPDARPPPHAPPEQHQEPRPPPTPPAPDVTEDHDCTRPKFGFAKPRGMTPKQG